MEDNKVFECPHCHSDQIQCYEIAYSSGASDIKTKSSTTGIGMAAGHLGIGVATTDTKGSSQTKLAISTAPPQKEPVIKIFIGTVFFMWFLSFIIACFDWSTLARICNYGAIPLAFVLALQAYLYNKNKWPVEMDTWKHSYICMRCGNRFTLY